MASAAFPSTRTLSSSQARCSALAPLARGHACARRRSRHAPRGRRAVLHQDSHGLQLQARDGRWHMVSATADQLVVIVGDMLERLSSGYFRATPHKVAATATGAAAPRRSLVFFCALDEDAEAQPLAGGAPPPPLPTRGQLARATGTARLAVTVRRARCGVSGGRLDCQGAHRLRRLDGGARA